MGKNSQTKPNRGDAVISLMLALLCVFVLVQSRHYSLEAARFPRVVASGTLLLSGWVLFRHAAVYVRLKKDGAVSGATGGDPAGIRWKGLAVAAAGFVYTALLRPLGFAVSTFAVLVVLPPLLGYRRHWITVVTAVVLTVFFYVVFSLFLTVPLPRGLL